MKILVTGGCGFIGSHVVDRLLEEGHDIYIYDNLSTGKHSWKGREVIAHDITSPTEVHGVFMNFRPEIVIHLAAQPSLATSMKVPAFDAKTNILGTINLLEASKDYGVKRFVFVSTSAAEAGWTPYFSDSDGPVPPTSPYGISKLAAEHYVLNLTRGFTSPILRLANVYGPRQVILGENQLVPHVLNHVYKNENFQVHNDGSQTRGFIYVKDVANAIYLAATHRHDAGGVFNISSGYSHSVNEVLDVVRNVTGYKKAWKHKSLYEMRMRVEMDNSLFVKWFGWKPAYSLEDGLKETVEWYKEAK